MQRGRLFWKYVVVFVGLVGGALLTSAAIEIWFSYQQNTAALVAIQREKAQAAAGRIEAFVKEIERQMDWVTQPQLVAAAAAVEQRRLDFYRLQRQVLAITDLAYLDAAGKEQLKVSRHAMEVVGSQTDFSAQPKFREARQRTWLGPVYFRKGSEPYMTIAVPHSRGAGVTVADINLKFIWDVVSPIKVGKSGHAYAVDTQGNLIAHPEISLVLQMTSLADVAHVRAALAAGAPGGAALDARDRQGRDVVSAYSAIPSLRWLVFVEQPRAEAYAPVWSAVTRTILLVVVGVGLSIVASLMLARRMVRPIRALQEGAARIGAGELGHRIEVRTGDELEALAEQFNRMTAHLQESYATLERRVDERTRELSEALEQQTATAEILRVISSSPTDLQPTFDAILEHATRLCDAHLGTLGLYDGEHFRHVTHKGASPEFAVWVMREPWRPHPSTAVGRMIAELEPIHILDMRDDPAYHEREPARVATVELGGARTFLAVPMIKDDRLVGGINIYRSEVRPFTDQQVALLQTFANQAVIAIENVRLFTELQEKNRAVTEALEQQTATAEILKVISRATSDLTPVFQAVVEEAVRLCEVDNASLLRRDGDVMRYVTHAGSFPEQERFIAYWADFPLHPGRGTLTGRALLDRRTVQIEDVDTDPEYDPDALLGKVPGSRTHLGIPLLKDGEVIGLIMARRFAVRPFTPRQVRLLETFADQAVIAIENVRLFTELQEKNRAVTEALEQQTATSEILRVISSSPTDVQPVFDTITRSAVKLCDATSSIVTTFDGELIHLSALSNMNPEGADALRRSFPMRPGRESGASRAILSRAVVQIPDTRDDPELVLRDAADVAQYRSVLVIPMLREGNPIGTVNVHKTESGLFTDEHVQLLKTFADQAVIAIENVRLFTELQERNQQISRALQQQTATAEILQVISSSPTDMQPVFDAIVRSAVTLCNGKTASVYRYDGNLVHNVALSGSSPEVAAEYARIFPSRPDRGGPVGRAILERAVIYIADALEEPTFQDIARLRGFRAAVVVPMLREGQPIGAIGVSKSESGDFTEEQVELVKTFANQAVIAIENVRLFTELQEKNRDVTEALDRQTATAEVLRVISTSQSEVRSVFETIVESAARLCAADFAAVLLVEDEQLVVVGCHGFADAMLRHYPRPVDTTSLNGRAIVERRIIHVPDLTDPSAPPRLRAGLPPELRFRSQLSVPMLRGDQPIGVVVVARREIGPFSESQIDLLKTFADQAVIAIENARLLDELQARTRELMRTVDELEALGEVSRSVTSTLDVETVLQTIVSRASQLAGADGCSIFRYDEDSETFVLRATHGPMAGLRDAQRPTTLRRGEGVVGRLPDTREPIQVPDIVAERAYQSSLRDALLHEGYRALLAVPLIREGRVVGGLVVSRKAPGEFPSQTVELLKRFATQSSLALWNASLYRELDEKSRELEVANRHKSEFLANMSHELRTPLNAVIGFSEVLIERMFGDLNDKQEEYLRDIYSSGRHLLSLINDILDLSKIEAGRMELDLTTFDLPQAVDNALTLVRGRADAHGIRLDVEIDRRLGDFVGDERKFKQILLNLLSNAVKFTPEGGRVGVRAALANGSVEVAVADTGIGIAPEDQQTVFEEFRQVGTDYARKREGTGLGLALTKRFVELHGGSIWLKSAPGEGSTFTFTLPVIRRREG